jgi:hypothetical protein
MTILSTWLNNKKSGARWWSWAPDSRTRLPCFKRPSEKTSYEKSDRRSNTITDRDFIDDYLIIWVSPHLDPNNEAKRISDRFLQQVFNDQSIYDDKIRLLFIKLYSTSTETSAQSDRRGEPVGQIGAQTPELVYVEWSTSNVPPPQKKLIQAQSARHD